MATIGPWWLVSVPRLPHEEVDGLWAAETAGPRGQRDGGQIVVTSQRVAFVPHRFGSRDKNPWVVSCADLSRLDDAGSGGEEDGLGRIRFTLKDGGEIDYVVRSPERVLPEIAHHLRKRRG